MPLTINRRTFLENCATALGGLAIVGSAPQSMFAVRRPATALHEESIWSMGTQVRLSITRDAYSPKLFEKAFGRVRHIDRALSVHRPESELSLLNDNPGVWHSASGDLLAVSQTALELGRDSDGALDVTVLPVLRRLGFAPGSKSGSDPVNEVVDYRKLRTQDQRVLLASGGYAVDFGGIAKGYAVDQAVGALREGGIHAALLDAGGDLYALGRPDDNRQWRIGIRDPFQPDSLFAVLDVADEAVATSGTYAQKRVVDGVEVSHIIDPKTCKSVHHVVSATVVTRETMHADALATAISVMPPAASLDLIESMPNTEAFWVFADRRTAMTTGLRSRLRLL